MQLQWKRKNKRTNTAAISLKDAKKNYFEITFIRGVPIFVGRLIHLIKNLTNNEAWEAVWHQYIAIWYSVTEHDKIQYEEIKH